MAIFSSQDSGGRNMRIALSGKAGCGKTTIANQLEERYGFKRFSFAAKLKEICEEMFPEIMALPKAEHRWLLQTVGTEMFRSIDDKVWVKYLIRQMEGEKVVVDDTRFKNEAKSLREAGFKVVLVDRDAELREGWGYNVDDPHQSEKEIDELEFDYVLLNDGDYPFTDAVFRLLAWMVNQ